MSLSFSIKSISNINLFNLSVIHTFLGRVCFYDKIKQASNTKHLLFKIPETFEYITKLFTMEPGDIIATGTPAGIGPVIPGDLIEATIEGIGTLT
ncbi:unnamed protein product, partial [marine sediment metagenome]